MALQFSRKAGLVGALVGAAFILHFGNSLVKPLVVPEKKYEDVNSKIRRCTEEDV